MCDFYPVAHQESFITITYTREKPFLLASKSVSGTAENITHRRVKTTNILKCCGFCPLGLKMRGSVAAAMQRA